MNKKIKGIKDNIIKIGPKIKMVNKRKIRFLEWLYEEETNREANRKLYHDFLTVKGNRFINGVLIR